MQLTFQRLLEGDEGDAPQATAEPTPISEGPSEAPPAVAKYFQDPQPGTPAWVFPVIATLFTVLVGGGFLGYRLYKKAHYL